MAMRNLMKSFRVHLGGFTPFIAPFWVITTRNVLPYLLAFSVCFELRYSYK